MLYPARSSFTCLIRGYGLVTHLSYVPSDYWKVEMLGSLPEKDRAELIGRARRDYEEMCRAEYGQPRVTKDRG